MFAPFAHNFVVDSLEWPKTAPKVVKNRRTQVVRHERGPGLLMMRAYEESTESTLALV